MSDRELIAALRRLRVQTGSLVCFGRGYEHNCGIHGCRILRVELVEAKERAAELMEELT